ncbi:MAG: hypothetical protein H0W72_06595 [Planctomycetes bacterium]|nr:hypothetical protein [Planctomycetota bacterium]
MRALLAAAWIGSATAACAHAADRPAVGQDLVGVFQRAASGQPLVVVNIGGSITQAGGGWAWDRLAQAFPASAVVGYNAGLSGTGSDLAVFRLERDVCSHQPDLVFIEFAVNDRFGGDEAVIRDLESIVRRLKLLPRPPAIVLLQSAFQGGIALHRHEAVARHYGLLAIDLHDAVARELAVTGAPWSNLIADDTHPTTGGHQFYAQVIAERLAPFIEQATARAGSPLAPEPPLPGPLSAQPLLLDGQLATFPLQPGWIRRGVASDRWDAEWYQAAISSTGPGSAFTIPVRGTAIGIFYAQQPGSGPMLVSIDGGQPQLVDTEGTIFGQVGFGELAAGTHLLSVAIPPTSGGTTSAPVTLGYLLSAGETGASTALVAQGPYTPAAMARLRFDPLPAERWMVIGPFGGEQPTPQAPTADLATVFLSEPEVDLAVSHPGRDGRAQAWRPATGTGRVVDFAAMSGIDDRGVHYAYAEVEVDQAQRLLAAWTLDYFGTLWVNGARIVTYDCIHGGPGTLHLHALEFQPGVNRILVKLHSGSRGNNFTFALERPAGRVEIRAPPFAPR